MKKFTAIIASLALMAFGLTLIPTSTHAAINCSDDTIPQSVLRANGCSSDTPELNIVIINIINGVVGALSLVAVIVIVIGGVTYMTSAGDAGKVEKAKKTILYAAVGLIICVLAFAIVNFVIANILKNSSGDNEGEPPVNGGGPISLIVSPED